MPSPEAAEKISGWPGTIAEESESAPSKVARRTAETSEVFPCGSVAVAVTMGRPAGGANGTSKTAWPWLSVVTSSDPR